jgi:hypothetical protein
MTEVSDTLAERGARYGSFFDHALIAQSMQQLMRGTDAIKTGWDGLSPDMQQALTVIADKVPDLSRQLARHTRTQRLQSV